MPAFPIVVDPQSPFPAENIPFGIFTPLSEHSPSPRACTAIGEYVLDLSVIESRGLFEDVLNSSSKIFAEEYLNSFACLPRKTRAAVREAIIALISSASSKLFTDAKLNQDAFHPISKVQMRVPMQIPEFTDFSCFEEHVRNCCIMGKMPFAQNFYHSPIAYNGRTSSIILSGQDVCRPRGMYLNSEGVPEFMATSKLDYELEMGVLISKPVPYGQTITADKGLEEHVFGYVLLNDWSARDIQMYESFPAGPLNCKSFASSISPWVIVPEALAPAATHPLNQKNNQGPIHLHHSDLAGTLYDIDVNAYVARQGNQNMKLSTTNLKHSYFSIGQMLAHRGSSGCGMRTGELIGTGTMSSPASLQIDKSVCHNACLFELSKGGTTEVPIVGGKWLEDGDRVTFDGWATGKNGRRIGFGELTTKILPVAISTF